MNKVNDRNVAAQSSHELFPIRLNAFGVLMTDELRKAITRKIGRVRQYAPDSMRAVVDVERSSDKRSSEQFRVFVRYELPGYDVTAEHRAHEPLAAIDIVAEKIERRLRKRKTALLASRLGRHGRPVRIADFCMPPQAATTSNLIAGAAL